MPVAAVVDRLRARSKMLDHLVRTYQHYQRENGDRLAAAVTFSWFLSLFPIVLIGVYVTSLVLGDDAGRQVTKGLDDYLGRATAGALGHVVQNSAGEAGVIGLVGVLFAGLGWIQMLRGAVRSIWGEADTPGNLVTRKVADVLALLGLFGVIAASVGLTYFVTQARDTVLDALGLADTAGVGLLTVVLGYAVSLVVDLLVFLYLFRGLARVRSTVVQALRGGVFGALGFELLKYFGAYYVKHTTTKGEATYGTFAVVVGLLLFLNLVSRLVLYTAAFTVTASYDVPVPPELVLRQDAPMERSWSPKHVDEPAPDLAVAAAAPGPMPGEKQVQLAARAVSVASFAVVAAVGLYGLRTVTRMIRR